MSKQSSRKWHKMLAYVLALVLLITAVPVAVSKASDYVVPEEYTKKAANFKTEWKEKGNDGKTTLFIGDSFMSTLIWRNFYDFYQGKDVLRAGIESTRAEDWQVLTADFLAHTNPKNLVVNLGTNDVSKVYDSGAGDATADQVVTGLTTLFETIHATLPNTSIYYFGISVRERTELMPAINAVNASMKTWCSQNNWITYVDTSAVTTSDLFDRTHLKPESYKKLVDALDKSGIVIEEAKKNIDIYLIAGQSNAAGWTTYDEATLKAIDSRYVDGFENIYYSGTTAVAKYAHNPRSFSVQNVKAGFGYDASKIGPEIGIADSLSSRYNSETGKYAGFIKYAVGASPLLKERDEEKANVHETWTSPTYMAKLDASVTEGSKMGVLYTNFLAEVETRLAEYEETGFNPIIKGMYWMQGEQDRGLEKQYMDAFEDFIADARKDLTTISGQNLSEMPVMIGEISETFMSSSDSTVNKNREFIAMQNALPAMISNCYMIDNSGFKINGEDGEVLGSDNSHWNYQDCIAIGKQVGDQIKKFNSVETGDVNADKKVDGTDASRLRHMLVRKVEGSSYMITPDVYVSYDDGQAINDGDATIAVETCKLSSDGKLTESVKTTNDNYTTSRNGDANGAIITNHAAGPYTVVRDYEFGKEDFTISTWFNVPGDTVLSGGAGTYLMGNDIPDGTTGFSATLKDGSIRFKLLSLSARTLRRVEGNKHGLTFNRDEWHNLVINREDNIIRVYFDGEVLFSESIPEGYDFGTRDLGIGAYVGATYQNDEMCFDDVQVYGTALNATEINAILSSSVLVPERNDVNSDKNFDIKDLVSLKKAVANYKGVAPVDVDAADVEVSFDNGTVKNSGTNTSMTAGAYVLGGFETVVVNGQEKQKATRFDRADNVSYTNSKDGAVNGAILTNHQTGAYTVLDNLELGKEDFAVSAWFNAPIGETIGEGNGYYLLGTTKADDTTDGFRVILKTTDAGVQLAFRSGTNAQEYHTLAGFKYGEWHHITVARVGSALFFYPDGELSKIQIIGEDFDFGDAKIAFGAYPGVTWLHDDADTIYDEIRLYKGKVAAAHVRDIYGVENIPGEDTSDTTAAKVKVTFDGGKVENIGTDTNATAGAYVMDATTNGTAFNPTDTVTYTTGRDGTAKGAIITNHQTGPYTVIKNAGLGKGDFTVSTWFSTEKVSAIGNNAGFYLFGTNKPDTGKGFSICIKKVSEEYRLRIRGAYMSTDEAIVIPNIESNTWYNVTIARVGSVINLYFDGLLVGTYTVGAYDFENRDLAFGGYYGLKDTYNNEETYFDDILVYGVGLSESQIQKEIMGMEPAKVEITFDGGTVVNTGTDTSIEVGTYVMDATINATKFNTTNTVTYATGRDGSAKGAIVTNHQTGPYAVVKNYNFGTGDFTVSTWINPQKVSSIGNNAGCYLFGTNHANTGNGFSVVLKKNSSGKYEIRLRAVTQSGSTTFHEIPDIESNTWYHVTIARVGTALNIYFDGSLVGTYTVGTYDFGIKDLAFGAYYGFDDTYNNEKTYYDDIKVYSVGLSANQVKQMYINAGKVDNSSDVPEGTETPPVFEEGTWQ